ncbi:zinc ribbon domain-containing protein [Streptomyces gardneri]|uniref:zinc ribbon domain-containing protein n=1 Tax=Streptomyces gardneri TaxID=66892 RepID=UPI00367E7017
MPESETVETDDGERKYTGRVFPYRDPETLATVQIGEGIITVGERELIIRRLEARTFPKAGKRQGQGKSLLTGIARCGLCGSRMSKEGTSYVCANHRMGRDCAGVSARVESIHDYVTRVFLSHLPSLESQDPLLGVIADRWSQKKDPAAVARRDAVVAEIADEEARLTCLEEATCARGESGSADARDPYDRTAAQLRHRIEALRADLSRMPMPSVDMSLFLDADRLREAWEGDDATDRRERLGLAVDRVEVRRGRVGVRFDGDERCRIVWAVREGSRRTFVTGRSHTDGKLEA